MAVILSRIEDIKAEIRNCEDLYQCSHSESEKAGLQRQMSRLTTQYIKLAEML